MFTVAFITFMYLLDMVANYTEKQTKSREICLKSEDLHEMSEMIINELLSG